MPFEQWLAPKTRSQNGYEIAGWYDWRLNNWGTKWDVVDVQITQPLTLHDDEEDVAPERLVNMGISVDADYQDEGMMFEGTYLNGDDECWEPEIEEEEEA
jgi:hypothetical protein